MIDMSDQKEKKPDEIYCSSCGEPIKKEAEICPHCGVRQDESQQSEGSETSDKKEKKPDEIYCSSCGEPIKKEAEICPHCGVPQKGTQKVGSSTSQETNSRTYSPSHDPSQYETTASNTWWYGLAVGLPLWLLFFAIAPSSGDATGPLATASAIIVLLAWVFLPISAYFDIQYIRANAKWNPHTVLWVILLLIPIVNLVSGVIYLYRRHEVLGAP